MQTEYILGKNPLNMSYMVGYQGPRGDRTYPTNVHHRASSLPAKKDGEDVIDCSNGKNWLRWAPLCTLCSPVPPCPALPCPLPSRPVECWCCNQLLKDQLLNQLLKESRVHPFAWGVLEVVCAELV